MTALRHSDARPPLHPGDASSRNHPQDASPVFAPSPQSTQTKPLTAHPNKNDIPATDASPASGIPNPIGQVPFCDASGSKNPRDASKNSAPSPQSTQTKQFTADKIRIDISPILSSHASQTAKRRLPRPQTGVPAPSPSQRESHGQIHLPVVSARRPAVRYHHQPVRPARPNAHVRATRGARFIAPQQKQPAESTPGGEQ